MMPSSDHQQLAQALYRAHVASRPRHEDAAHPVGPPQSNGQDGDLISVAAAARLLAMSRRQVQRLAAHDADLLGARRVGSIWALKRSAVLALAAGRKATT